MISPLNPKAKPSPADIQSLELVTIPCSYEPSLQVRLVKQQLQVSTTVPSTLQYPPQSLCPHQHLKGARTYRGITVKFTSGWEGQTHRCEKMGLSAWLLLALKKLQSPGP